ncbi:MAG TPA: MarR family transcriptional regulator [Candidatus Eremiobacteraceae bacterium]|nr:MarR family transcriptional regulator [Candidatus Eremiobacteraceae bacterium]
MTVPPDTKTTKPPEADPNPEAMEKLRGGIAHLCASFGTCDYDSVNAILTIKRTAMEFENFSAVYFRQYGLSPGRFNVLMALFGLPDHTQSLSDLGDYLVVTRANITGLVDGLVEDGFLRRLDHPDDRRVVLAQLTPKAIEFLNWFAPLHHQNIKTLLAPFSTKEKREVVAFCDKLRAQLRSTTPLLETLGGERKESIS